MPFRNYLSFLTVLLCVIMGTSCTSTYISNTPNIPLLTHPKEVQVSAQAGTNGYMVQGAYSPAKSIGIIASGDFYTFKQDITNRKTLHYLVEMGAGGYIPFGKTVRFETYAGYGHGFSLFPGAKGGFHRIFIQPDFGITTKFIDLGVASRFSWVGMYNFQTIEEPTFRKQSNVFWEPAITSRIGYGNSKLVLQFSGEIPFAKKANIIYDTLPLVFTVGIHINFMRTFED